jgi:hypothetical protein
MSIRAHRPPDPEKLHPAVRDLWPTHAGPNVLAWTYADDDPDCHTLYTVFVAHPGGRPRIQFTFRNGEHMAVTIDEPERFGEWDTPTKFREWARAWKRAGDPETHPIKENAA